jgi:hypothetical protein
MNEIQCRMYRPDGTRCTLAPGHTEEEGPHGEPGVRSTRIPAGEIIFEGGITIPFEPGDLTFKAEDYHADEPKKPLDLSGSFTANLRALDVGGFLAAITKPEVWTTTAAYTLTVTYTRPRNPPIGELRRWAASVSSTPWRRRSIASWRWLWRRTATAERSVTFENVVIKPGTDTLHLRTEGRMNYDVVMYGRHA